MVDQQNREAPAPETEAPIVSVVTSTYNRAGLLRRAIDSVRAQTFTAWEHLVVGDCTPDNTAEVVASYGDPRLRFHNLEVKSPPGSHGAIAKNFGIQHMARGRYIAYLDDDDRYLPDFLRVMVDALERRPDLPIAYCRSCYRDKDSGKRIMGNPFQRWMHGYSRAKLERFNLMVSQSVVHRRGLLDEVGYWNPDFFFDDYELWRRIACRHDFLYVNRVLVETFTKADPFAVRMFRKGWTLLRRGRRTPLK